MATPFIVLHNQVETMRGLNQPFKGFSIAIVLQHDTAGTAITPSLLPDFNKLRLELKNKNGNYDCWDAPLDVIHRFYNAGDKDLFVMYYPSNMDRVQELTPGGSGNEIVMISPNINCSTYHGNYELTVTVGSDFFKPNTKQNSYVALMPIYSDDPMIFEEIILFETLDKQKNSFTLGNGIEEIQLMRLAASNPALTAISKVQYTALEQSQDFTLPSLIAHSETFEEEKHRKDKLGQLIVHNDEVLTNCHVSIEMKSPNSAWLIVYRVLKQNQDSRSSVAMQATRVDNAESAAV